MAALPLLSPDQKVELIFHPGMGDMNNISDIVLSLLRPLLNNEHVRKPIHNLTLQSNATASSMMGNNATQTQETVSILLCLFNVDN